MKNKSAVYLTTALLAAAIPLTLQGQSTWNGGDGEYTTGANWTPTGVPNTAGGATALINSGNVTYFPGGDLTIRAGGALNLTGGSFEQIDGAAWMRVGDIDNNSGAITITNASFNAGTSGNMLVGAASGNTGTVTLNSGSLTLNGLELRTTGSLVINGGTAVSGTVGGNAGASITVSGGPYTPSSINMDVITTNVTGGILNIGTGYEQNNAKADLNISEGTVNFSGNFTNTNDSGAFNLSSSGTATFTGEMNATTESYTMNGGSLIMGLGISFAGANKSVDLTGGTISLDGDWNNSGFYAGGISQSLNFTSGSTGTLILRNSNNFAGLLSSNIITIDGASADELDFNTNTIGNDLYISTIPEPSTIFMALTGMGLLLVTLRRRK